MKAYLKKTYISKVEKYFYKSSVKKLNTLNINLDNIPALESIKNHILDLNEKDLKNINKDDWYISIKNKYRLFSSVYRYIKTKEVIENYIEPDKTEIIDFGAGNGVFLEFLQLKGTGIDINKKCVEHMRSIGIESYCLDELNDKFKEKYDHSFAFEVIEHVENQLLVLNDIYKYIKKDGYLFLSIPYVKNSHVLQKQNELTATKRLENYHIFELDLHDFKNLVSHTSFKLISYEHLNPHQLSSNLIGKFFDRIFRANRPKWTIFILKKC